MAPDLPKVGVEEEFLLLDAETARPAPRIAQVIRDAEALVGDAAQTELHRAQIEIATSACDSLEQVQGELADLRSKIAAAAASHGAVVVASGTLPVAMGFGGRLITENDRYEEMAAANALIAEEQMICGCHVHVTVDEPDAAVAVMNRVRRWLPYLLAISANSPFWDGRDTGYASYRAEVWSRWPTSGPPGEFRDAEEYWGLVDTLVSAGVILDRGMAYWDVRPSGRYPTLEVRVADVTLSPRDAAALAGLIRALVVHCRADESPPPRLRPELLRAATWRAARSGLSGELIDPLDGSRHRAARAIREMMGMLRPSLERLGDRSEVNDLVEAILAGGNGAERQRAAFDRREDIADVVAAATLRT